MRIIFLFLLSFLFLQSENITEENSTQKVLVDGVLVDKNIVEKKDENKSFKENKNEYDTIYIIKNEILSLKIKLFELEKKLETNTWLISYNNYYKFQKITAELTLIQHEIEKLKSKKKKKKEDKESLADFAKKEATLKKQLLFLDDYKNNPFDNLIKPEEILEAPKVTNPILIMNALSYIKNIKNSKIRYERKIEELKDTLELLKEYKSLLKEIGTLSQILINLNRKYDINLTKSDIVEIDNVSSQKKLKEIFEAINEFNDIKYISKSTFDIYSKKIDESIIQTKKSIERQIKSIIDNLEIIIIFVLFSFLFKFLAKKYIEDNEKVYKVNKFINFLNLSVIVIVLLFAYIDNIKYLVTIIGFASAGLAIAMKDLFMSVLGWFVIIFGGNFHVGDRIKVQKDGFTYVGDIVDISLLNLIVLEDVTYTTYLENRRAGRIIFVPNHYIFTSLIANYSHSSLKTVWDGIDITITFESNHKKAMFLAKEIVKRYSRGYTDISRKQLNKLRNRYSLKNTNVEPRIFSFIEENGIRISCWYMTSSFATLTLRSSISSDILDAYLKEEDIKIAYPTQSLKISTAYTENRHFNPNSN